ncbi:hypothetical protein ScPMuIL_000181 [Solemya velum]
MELIRGLRSTISKKRTGNRRKNCSGPIATDPSRKLNWDPSNANKVTVPKTVADLREKTDAMLRLISFMKTEIPPSGIVVDKTKATPNFGQYREEKEFIKLQEILGRGNSAGDIVVVKDIATGSEFAQKTVMLSVFRKEEIKAWVDLSGEEYFPCLYHFQLKDNKMVMHMEKIENALTLTDVVNNHMLNLSKVDPDLAKPFSLYVFNGMLNAVKIMNKHGWTHRDLHSGNVLLSQDENCKLQVKVIDFGSVGQLETERGLDTNSFRSDIANVVRLFSALYMGDEFESVDDVRNNWEEKLKNRAEAKQMKLEERNELFCLIDSVLKIITPGDVERVTEDLKSRLKQETESEIDEVMKKVAGILFSKNDFINMHPDTDHADGVDCPDMVIGDSPFEVSDEMIKRLRSFMSIGQHHS